MLSDSSESGPGLSVSVCLSVYPRANGFTSVSMECPISYGIRNVHGFEHTRGAYAGLSTVAVTAVGPCRGRCDTSRSSRLLPCKEI